MELFLQPELVFEKLAMGVEMPEDPNGWPQAVLQELFKQIPFISDFSPNVTMDKVDAEKGYGFGHVTITQKTEIQQQVGVADSGAAKAAGMREIRIPVVIKQNKLAPLDLLVTDDSKVVPLTESRLRQSIFRPQAFDVTGRTPGDQSMIGQLYPPYRQNYGFGGGGAAMNVGMGKDSHVKGSELEDYLKPEDVEKDAGAKRILRVAEAMGKKGYGRGEDVPKGLLGAFDRAKSKAHRRIDRYPSGGPELMKTRGHVDASRKADSIMAKHSSVLEAIAPTITQTDLDAFKRVLADNNVKLAYEVNAAATLGALKTLLECEPTKMAEIDTFVRPTVVQLVRGVDNYTVKMANHQYWNPQTVVLTRGEAIQQLGEKIVLAADLNGAATVAEGATAAEAPPGQEQAQPPAPGQEAAPDADMQNMGPVTEFGLYKVQTDDGQELVGYVIPNLIDIDGSEVPLALFTNGSVAAIQADIMGTPIQSGADALPTGDAPSGYGAFFSQGPEGIKATVPMEISGSFQGPQGAEGEAPTPGGLQATTFDGRGVEVSQQPNIQTVVPMDGKMLIPEHWQWLPLNKAESVSLVGGDEDAPKEASAQRHFASVYILSGGSTFSFHGPAVEKLAEAEREFVNVDDAMFILAGLGVEQQYGIRKLGQATSGREPVQIRIGRYIKTAADQKKEASARGAELLSRLPNLKRPLFKEAAVITDPDAVDAVLSIGFINPENISSFISYLPEIDGAQTKLCELLLAARLGLSNVDEGALEKSIRSAEEVIEGLKTLAFEGAGHPN